MADIVVIGAGRLGTALGRALAEHGHKITALTCRKTSSARESRKIIGRGKIFSDNAAASRRGKIVFLCLPDESIADVAEDLSRASLDWSQKIVFHTSGLLSSAALKPLKRKGAAVASFHPVQSFAKKSTPATHFRGVFFGLEGDRRALAVARKLVFQLGGQPVVISARKKPLYHAACSIASNFLVVILAMAADLIHQAGIEEKRAALLLFPLVEGTLRNVKKLNILSSLTGPVARGDATTVKAHLKALCRFPNYARAYRAVSRLALDETRKRKLPPQNIRALKNLLERK